MDWCEKSFFPVVCCNTYSIHQIPGPPCRVLCVTLFGKVVWMDNAKEFDLRLELEGIVKKDDSVELVVSDCAAHNDCDTIAFLATCWVVYDDWCRPNRYFAALFRISKNSTFSFGCRIELENPPAYTRITSETYMGGNHRGWLIFTSSQAVRLFLIEASSATVEEVDSIGDIYPGLDLGDLPGSVIRSSCIQTSSYRWSVLGFDTGYVIGTILSLKNNYIVERCKLKFSGPISVLQLLRREGYDDIIYALISSTLGPPAVWTFALSSDRSSFEWKRMSVLKDCLGHDTIVCCSVCIDFVAIGTYGQQLLIYRREDLMYGEPSVSPCSSIPHSSPIIAIRFLSVDSMAVLSVSGLHLLVACKTPSSVFTDDDQDTSLVAVNFPTKSVIPS